MLDVKISEIYRVKDNMIDTILPWHFFWIGICAVLYQNLFSCNLCCFVAKPDLAQFTHFLCGETMTNIMFGDHRSSFSTFSVLTTGWKLAEVFEVRGALKIFKYIIQAFVHKFKYISEENWISISTNNCFISLIDVTLGFSDLSI